MKIFYHKNCLDGISSAAIVNIWAKENNLTDIEFFPVTPEDKVPLDKVQEDEKVFILDYSLDIQETDNLLNITSDVIWIDHHLTAIRKYDNYNKQIMGKRSSGRCAAYLTWGYLYPEIEVPQAIKYVDDCDRVAELYTESNFFKRGALLYSQLGPENINYWKPLLKGGGEELQQTLDAGQIIESNVELWRKKARGYEIKFEGLKVLTMNRPGNSESFKYIDDGTYDALMIWIYNGKEYYYSLYQSKKSRGTLDLSKIAARYGGGGHAEACGFRSKKFLAKSI